MSGRLEGGKELQRRLKALQDTEPILRQIQITAVREAKDRVPRKTGFLARSIHPGTLGRTFAIVEASAPYAAFVELGTRAHVIRPRNASVLAWPASSSGRRLSGRRRTNAGPLIFAKLVHHPGTKPFPYLLPGAIAAVKRAGIDPIVQAWNRAA